MSQHLLKLASGQEYQRGALVLHKKAKDFYAVENHPDLWIMRHLDVVTRDDNGNIKEEIPGKGVLNAKINDTLFRLLHGQSVDKWSSVPIKTHYLGASLTDEAECLVYRIAQAIPLEVIVRNSAYGSYVSRQKVAEGTVLDPPVCEFTLKDDAHHDPLITPQQILAENIATNIEITHMREVALTVNRIMGAFFLEIGIDLVDFKLVFGRQGNFVGDYSNMRIIGELSPDVCRLRDRKTGKCLDKDIFRHELPGLAEAYTAVAQRMSAFRAAEEQKRRRYRIYNATSTPQ